MFVCVYIYIYIYIKRTDSTLKPILHMYELRPTDNTGTELGHAVFHALCRYIESLRLHVLKALPTWRSKHTFMYMSLSLSLSLSLCVCVCVCVCNINVPCACAYFDSQTII